MMSKNTDKKATVGGILQIILTQVFILVFGILFSYLTGYESNNNIIIIRILVWMMNLIIAWIVSTVILKFIFKKNISFLSYKYICFAYVLSVLIIWSIGMDENDYSYVASAITIISTIGAIWGIKLYKKKRGRPPKS